MKNTAPNPVRVRVKYHTNSNRADNLVSFSSSHRYVVFVYRTYTRTVRSGLYLTWTTWAGSLKIGRARHDFCHPTVLSVLFPFWTESLNAWMSPRMPYFSYLSMLFLFETLGWWSGGAEVRKIHFAEVIEECNTFTFTFTYWVILFCPFFLPAPFVTSPLNLQNVRSICVAVYYYEV